MKLKKVCAIVFKLVQLINVLDLFVEKVVSNILMLYNNKRKYEKFGQSRITGVVSYSFNTPLSVVRIPIDIKNRELVRIVNV